MTLKTKRKPYSLPSQKVACWILFAGLLGLSLSGQDACAVQAGEMRQSVNYLMELLNNNIVPAMIAAGIVASIGFAFIKQQFGPLVIAMCTTIGYGFARAWVNEVYALVC